MIRKAWIFLYSAITLVEHKRPWPRAHQTGWKRWNVAEIVRFWRVRMSTRAKSYDFGYQAADVVRAALEDAGRNVLPRKAAR